MTSRNAPISSFSGSAAVVSVTAGGGGGGAGGGLKGFTPAPGKGGGRFCASSAGVWAMLAVLAIINAIAPISL